MDVLKINALELVGVILLYVLPAFLISTAKHGRPKFFSELARIIYFLMLAFLMIIVVIMLGFMAIKLYNENIKFLFIIIASMLYCYWYWFEVEKNKK